jgi:hypothetical protein
MKEQDQQQLATVARSLAADPTLPIGNLAVDAVELGICRFGATSEADVLAWLLWVDAPGQQDTRARTPPPPLWKRRQEAAAIYGGTGDTLERDYEKHLFDELARQLIFMMQTRD